MNEERIEINGLDIIDIITLVHRKNRIFLALVLQELEEIIKDPEEFKYTRKVVLDYFNNYTRSILRGILGGDIEGIIFK